MRKITISKNLINIGKISSGTLIGQLISIISVPIITRLYGADIVGYMALFISISSVVNSFSDLGLTNAIMINDNEDDSHRIYKVVTTINLFISIIVSIFLMLFYNFPTGYNTIFITCIVFLLMVCTQQAQISYTWLNKKQKYNVLMKNPVLSQIAILIVSVPLAYMGQIKYGYFIGVLAGQVFRLINMMKNLPSGFLTFQVNDYKKTFKENKDFILYQFPTTVLTNLKNQMPTFLIQSFFGATILGYYSIAVRILNVPSQLLANSIGRVYFSTVSKMKNQGLAIGEYTFRNLKKATYISIIPMIMLITMSGLLVYIVLGETNVVAVEILRASSIQALFTFFMMSLSGIYIVINKQDYALKSVIAQMILYVVGFTFGKYAFDNIVIVLYIISIFYGMIQIVYFSFIFKAMGIAPIRYIKNIIFALVVILVSSTFILNIMNLFTIH